MIFGLFLILWGIFWELLGEFFWEFFGISLGILWEQETVLRNKECLKVLNDTKLILRGSLMLV